MTGPKSPQRSVVASAALVVFLLVALAGVILVVLGIDRGTIGEFKYKDVTIKGVETGSAMWLVGALSAAWVLTKVGKGVRLFADRPPSPRQRLGAMARPVALFGLVGGVVLLISLIAG